MIVRWFPGLVEHSSDTGAGVCVDLVKYNTIQ